MDYNLAAEVFHWNRNFSTSGPEVPSEDLMNQRRGLSLPVKPADGNEVTGRLPLMRNTIQLPSQTEALLRVATETRLLHGVDGVPQKLMGVLLASKAKMSRNFCRRQNTFSFNTGCQDKSTLILNRTYRLKRNLLQLVQCCSDIT